MTQTTTIGEPHGGPLALMMGRSLLEIAWNRKSLVGLGVVVGLIVGLLYYAQTTPIYQSKAQILVVKKRPDTFTGIDTRNLAIEDYVATHKTLIESIRSSIFWMSSGSRCRWEWLASCTSAATAWPVVI